MDRQIFDMLVDRFDAQDAVLTEIKNSLRAHAEEDKKYWKKIDVQDGQIALIKGIGSSSILAALGTYLWNKFH